MLSGRRQSVLAAVFVVLAGDVLDRKACTQFEIGWTVELSDCDRALAARTLLDYKL